MGHWEALGGTREGGGAGADERDWWTAKLRAKVVKVVERGIWRCQECCGSLKTVSTCVWCICHGR